MSNSIIDQQQESFNAGFQKGLQQAYNLASCNQLDELKRMIEAYESNTNNTSL